MGALNTKYEAKNVPKEKMEVNSIQINESNRGDYELFEKITSISKELYSLYKSEFLNESFCKKLSTIYKKKLFELDIQSLQNIHQQISNSNSNSKKLQAVLSYMPNENEKFMVQEFKTQLREYLWNDDIKMNPKIFSNKGIVLDNIPMTIIDPQNKLRYINIEHVNKILSQVHKKSSNNSNSNKVVGGARNNSGSSSSFSIPSLSSSSSSPSTPSISSPPAT